ncbi:hypothetical protein L1987_17045 [Smallanthus sonchifolius]|uniref:Uncharacterized protein n=1 Tax=Smallanthus sonchifolius TaxID=185202 RepID=A0ACB9IXC1_9ASTR|nr:hypothetical protein L1987_17045 [Smallanthus sonchifolius]
MIHDNLLFHYTDESDLMQHLKDSETPLLKGVLEVEDEEWRKKIQSVLPADGVVMKHIRRGEDVHLSRRVVAMFLFLTIADSSDQLFNFQDVFDNSDGKRRFSGNDSATALWPGDGKPGLWMNSLSRMGAIYTLVVREEQLYSIKHPQPQLANTRDEEIELVIPPIFENYTKILAAGDKLEARDLYWEGVCEVYERGLDGSADVLKRSVVKNPFVGEPHVVLGQVYLSQGRFDEAEKEAEQGLRLWLEWGSPWDKRMSWEGWIAWCMVLVMKAKEKSWPQTSWGILNLGLVR